MFGLATEEQASDQRLCCKGVYAKANAYADPF